MVRDVMRERNVLLMRDNMQRRNDALRGVKREARITRQPCLRRVKRSDAQHDARRGTLCCLRRLRVRARLLLSASVMLSKPIPREECARAAQRGDVWRVAAVQRVLSITPSFSLSILSTDKS